MKKLALSLAAGLAAVSFVSVTARAGTATSKFTATAKVPANCTFAGTATAIDFGSYDPLSGTATTPNASTSLTVNCTKGTAGTVTLGGSYNSTATAWQMGSTTTTDKLNYTLTMPTTAALTTDSGTAWTSAATSSLLLPASTGRASPITFGVYGHLSGTQDVSAATYSDSVTATVTF